MDNLNEQPKASDVIAHLNELIEKHGDLAVIADDPDTSWRMPIGIAYRNGGRDEPKGWFEVKTEYHLDPDGKVKNRASLITFP